MLNVFLMSEETERKMSDKEDKNRAAHSSYGTFHGVPTYPPPSYPRPPSHHRVSVFPQSSPPPGAAHDDISVHQYIQEHQTVLGYDVVADGRSVKVNPLPCCGLGIGWFFFIIGFFLAAIPWYIGVFILVCAKINPREKPGYIAAVLATIAIVLGVMGRRGAWS